MEWLPMCQELRDNAQSSDWIDMIGFYCRKSVVEDRKGIIAPEKAAEFLKETQVKDDAKLAKLHDLERQTELRAVEKELFIQNLLRNIPF
ncbi:hypothetical protein Tco_0482199 [Tanacetum coccineum]